MENNIQKVWILKRNVVGNYENDEGEVVGAALSLEDIKLLAHQEYSIKEKDWQYDVYMYVAYVKIDRWESFHYQIIEQEIWKPTPRKDVGGVYVYHIPENRYSQSTLCFLKAKGLDFSKGMPEHVSIVEVNIEREGDRIRILSPVNTDSKLPYKENWTWVLDESYFAWTMWENENHE